MRGPVTDSHGGVLLELPQDGPDFLWRNRRLRALEGHLTEHPGGDLGHLPEPPDVLPLLLQGLHL
eukprot:4534240-Pyramimonas_sp.AAC.1